MLLLHPQQSPVFPSHVTSTTSTIVPPSTLGSIDPDPDSKMKNHSEKFLKAEEGHRATASVRRVRRRLLAQPFSAGKDDIEFLTAESVQR